jgi:hypothetical protein
MEVMSEVHELVDAELDAVCGGVFDLSNLTGNIVVQPQIATQVGVAVGGFSVFGNVGAANLTQLLAQANVSSIG